MKYVTIRKATAQDLVPGTIFKIRGKKTWHCVAEGREIKPVTGTIEQDMIFIPVEGGQHDAVRIHRFEPVDVQVPDQRP